MRRVLEAIMVLTAITSSIGAQTTRLVPSQFPTIQTAIGAAQTGDTVLVSPGIYSQSINFLGKAITVTSSQGAEVTTISGNGTSRVVTFSSGEGPGSILSGFTIRDGRGGILIRNCSPTINDCTITANATNDSGGGVKILTDAGGANTLPTISNCRILNNNASFGSNPGFSNSGGGGISCSTSAGSSSPSFFGCRIADNFAYGPSAYGGGFHAVVAGSGTMSVNFTNCTFDHNAGDIGGAVGTFGTLGLNFTSCTFTDNLATTASGITGVGGAMWLSNSQTIIVNCLIARNTAVFSSSALNVNGNLTIQNSTIVSNGGAYSAIRVESSGVMSMTSSILWDNEFGDITWFGAIPTLSHCIVQSSFFTGNPTNLAVDPGFVDLVGGDYHIAANSPCADSGTLGALALPSTDLDGTARIVGTVDRGADEAPPQLLPGTEEDFDLYVRIDGAGDPLATQVASSAGSVLGVRLHSPLGGLAGAQPLLAGQLFASGMPPLGLVAIPAVHIDVVGSFVIYGVPGGNAFSAPGLPSDGIDFQFLVPPGLSGISLRLQAFASTPFAANGLFAISSARDVVF